MQLILAVIFSPLCIFSKTFFNLFSQDLSIMISASWSDHDPVMIFGHDLSKVEEPMITGGRILSSARCKQTS